MRLKLHFWAPRDVTEHAARTDVKRQVADWVEAEPNVNGYRLLGLARPYPDRATWWEAEVILDLA